MWCFKWWWLSYMLNRIKYLELYHLKMYPCICIFRHVCVCFCIVYLPKERYMDDPARLSPLTTFSSWFSTDYVRYYCGCNILSLMLLSHFFKFTWGLLICLDRFLSEMCHQIQMNQWVNLLSIFSWSTIEITISLTRFFSCSVSLSLFLFSFPCKFSFGVKLS